MRGLTTRERQTAASTAPMPNAQPWRRGQAPQPRSGAPKAQGLTATIAVVAPSNVPSFALKSTGVEGPIGTSDTLEIYTSLTDATLPAAFGDIPLDQQIRERIRTGRSVHRQKMTYRAPGSLRVYSYSVRRLQLDGDAARAALLVMDDITGLLSLSEEVRRTQLHLASIVDSAGDLIISTDAAGTILTWNTAAEQATGHAAGETLCRPLAELIAEPLQAEVQSCYRRIDRIDQRLTAEWPVTGTDGKAVPISWHLSPMRESDGGTSGVVIVGRNLVEQREMEAQMQ